MYSFYGGRPGNPFVIIATFNSKDQMIRAFQDGPNYTKVHYGEHVLINTEDKNSSENGQIYRRGYDFNNDMGGAEYIGTIVGPAGMAPMLSMDDYDTIAQKQAEDGYEQRFSYGQYKVEAGSLIPGKDGNTYNDKISWACCSIRDDNAQDTIAYIGFKIPYPVIDFEAQSISPYEISSQNPIISKKDDGTHPFYTKWHFNIPKGIKGDSLNNIYLNEDGSKLYYSYTNYDENEDGTLTTVQIGDYNIIKNISLINGRLTVEYTSKEAFQAILKCVNGIDIAQNGAVTITYNTGNDDTTTLTNKLQWVQGIELGANGEVTVIYNTSIIDPETQQSTDRIILDEKIKWINTINSREDGTISVTFNDNTSQNLGVIKKINDVQVDPDGTMTITYNTFVTDPETQQLIPETTVLDKKVKWIDNIRIENDGGYVYVEYNNGQLTQLTKNIEDEETGGSKEVPLQVRWIDNITINQDGDVTVEYNTYDNSQSSEESEEQQDQTINNKETAIFENVFRSLENIYIDDDSHMLTVQTNKKNDVGDYETKSIGGPVNYIEDAALDANGRLLMRFLWHDGDKESYEDYDDWTYVGSISGQNLGFKENQTTITDKYLTGIIDNNKNLIFDLNANRFLSSSIESTSITNCQIQVFDKTDTLIATIITSLDENNNIITVNQNDISIIYNNIITSQLFGIHCIFNNFGNTTPENFIPVNIFIKNIDLQFTIGDSGDDEGSSSQIDSRVTELQNSLNNISSIINNKTTGIASINNKLNTLYTPRAYNISNQDISIKSGGIGTTVASVKLTPGFYLFLGTITWPNNTKGLRQTFFTLDKDGASHDRYARVNYSTIAHQQCFWAYTVAETRIVYLKGYQNSGSTLTTEAIGLKVISLTGGTVVN